MTDLIETSQGGSIYEVPQQLLAGDIEQVPEDVAHALARACVVHCAAAALNQEHAPSTEELVNFVVEHGARSGSDLYEEGVGWNMIAVGDLLRHKGYSIISQSLKYDSDHFDLKSAAESGRVRSDYEKERLALLTQHGGSSRGTWLDALRYTQAGGGKVIASITIPLMSGNGFGTHAVLIEGIDDQGILTYFDPDRHNVERFGDNPPNIERTDGSRLVYRRPVQDFLAAMTGEVTHIFPPE